MKISPRADYPVGVRPREWEEPPGAAPHYAGVVDVSLNGMVTVTFVPDVSAWAPPFDAATLPDDLDAIASVRDARLAAVLLASYVVTPHATLHGTWERLPALGGPGGAAGPVDDDEPGAVVLWVEPEVYAAAEADLVALAQSLGGRHPDVLVSALRDRPALRLVESAVLASPAFSDADRRWLRDEG